jgi:hypothetical protein
MTFNFDNLDQKKNMLWVNKISYFGTSKKI